MSTQTAAAPANITIPAYYTDPDDVDGLFDYQLYAYSNVHAATFQTRKNINLGNALQLAMCLPSGAFLAGGFMKSLVHNTPIKDFDLFFRDEAAFKAMVKRIHGAPEGSFLHGYESDKDLTDFAGSRDKYMLFTHPSKPPIQLIRVRWYPTVIEALDKFDFSACQFAIDSDLRVHFDEQAIDDTRQKRIRVRRITFPISTGIRIDRLQRDGWSWWSDRFDASARDRWVRNGLDWLARAAQRLASGNTASDPEGSFEP